MATRRTATPVATQAQEEVSDKGRVPQDILDRSKALEHEMRRGDEIVSAALWEEGDLWRTANLNSSQYVHLSKVLHLDVGTLRERTDLANEIQESRRNPNLSWSVHKQIARIPDEEEQDRLLAQDDWSVDSVRYEVRRVLEAKAQEAAAKGGNKGTGLPTFRAGMSVGGIKVTGEREGDVITLTISAAVEGDPSVVTTRNGLKMILDILDDEGDALSA